MLPLLAPGTRLAMEALLPGTDREDVAFMSWMNAMPGTGRSLSRTVQAVIGWKGQKEGLLDRADELPGVLPPIALFWGSRDQIIPVAHAQALVERMEIVGWRSARASSLCHSAAVLEADARASHLRYIPSMKTSSLPPLRVEPRLREEAERLLREGETLSSFIVDAVEERIRRRIDEDEFIKRGLASAEKARRSGKYTPASSVIEGLRQQLQTARKRAARTTGRKIPKAR